MKLIESKTLATSAASIEFTSIPQTFTDLVLLISARSADASVFLSLELVINGLSTNQSLRFLLGDGSSASSGTFGNVLIGLSTGANATANTFANTSVYIPNYTSGVGKSISAEGVSENNATSSGQILNAGLSTATAAITSLGIKIVGGAANLVVGSTISLYGILKGSDGIVTTS
jgi:hypothetical protein